MALPGNFMGNASDPRFAGIKALVDAFLENVEAATKNRSLFRGEIPVLRPANFYLLADADSVHVVFTNSGAGGLPMVMIRDIADELPDTSIHNVAAAETVEKGVGWSDCHAVSLPRVLIDAPTENRDRAIASIAGSYLDGVMASADQARAESEARALLNAHPNASAGLLEGIKAAAADLRPERGVFVMMRYLEGENYAAIEHAIARILREFGLEPRLAKDKAYSDDLWENVRIYMHASQYGIAVFEEIDTRSFNPNVSIELGYMYALGRRVLLLKERRMPAIPTDIVGRIYKTFDSYRIEETVSARVAEWLGSDLGLRRLAAGATE